jgi:hypothetical protein
MRCWADSRRPSEIGCVGQVHLLPTRQEPLGKKLQLACLDCWQFIVREHQEAQGGWCVTWEHRES